MARWLLSFGSGSARVALLCFIYVLHVVEPNDTKCCMFISCFALFEFLLEQSKERNYTSVASWF